MSATTADEILLSADSHVMEDPDFWVNGLPAQFRDQAPKYPPRQIGEGFQAHPGGWDPAERLKEMAADGVSAEVLYPTLGLPLFSLDDAHLQEACFRLYNDWLAEYCQVAPERLVGVACIPVYDIEVGVAEMERTRRAGMKGAIIWQAPHPDLPFYSDHYEPLWDAAEALNMPISLHILTGHNYSKGGARLGGVEHYRGSVNFKTADVVNAVFDFIFYGILDRHPGLKLVTVENEVGWIPFYLQQWDYYYRRFQKANPPPISREPSSYFADQVFATFFNDAVGGHNFDWWGTENCMWSNDYPHPNSTWPNSRAVIDRDLGHLPANVRARLIRENVAKLYDIKIPSAVSV